MLLKYDCTPYYKILSEYDPFSRPSMFYCGMPSDINLSPQPHHQTLIDCTQWWLHQPLAQCQDASVKTTRWGGWGGLCCFGMPLVMVYACETFYALLQGVLVNNIVNQNSTSTAIGAGR